MIKLQNPAHENILIPFCFNVKEWKIFTKREHVMVPLFSDFLQIAKLMNSISNKCNTFRSGIMVSSSQQVMFNFA